MTTTEKPVSEFTALCEQIAAQIEQLRDRMPTSFGMDAHKAYELGMAKAKVDMAADCLNSASVWGDDLTLRKPKPADAEPAGAP